MSVLALTAMLAVFVFFFGGPPRWNPFEFTDESGSAVPVSLQSGPEGRIKLIHNYSIPWGGPQERIVATFDLDELIRTDRVPLNIREQEQYYKPPTMVLLIGYALFSTLFVGLELRSRFKMRKFQQISRRLGGNTGN